MSDQEAINDFPNEDQRFAFCISQWENKSINKSEMQMHKKLKENIILRNDLIQKS
jgi:hypothetical protein